MGLKALVRQVGNRIIWYPRSFTNREFSIGNQTIIVPPGHRLDLYAKDFPLYNQQIRIIASVIDKAVKDFYAIDIGANIGDTAAYIAADSRAKVLCIEGNPKYLPILEENSRRLDSRIVIERAFVGQRGLAVDPKKARDIGGTATVTSAVANLSTSPSEIPMLPLHEILEKHPKFKNTKLLKTDTDGYDFKILMESLSLLSTMKPVIFVEYDPRFSSSKDEGITCIRELQKIGFSNFLAFDNYGCAAQVLRDELDFKLLNNYLINCAKTLEGPIFFDLCCVHHDDKSLFNEILGHFLN